MAHNPERREFRGRSYRKGGIVRDLREADDLRVEKAEAVARLPRPEGFVSALDTPPVLVAFLGSAPKAPGWDPTPMRIAWRDAFIAASFNRRHSSVVHNTPVW